MKEQGERVSEPVSAAERRKSLGMPGYFHERAVFHRSSFTSLASFKEYVTLPFLSTSPPLSLSDVLRSCDRRLKGTFPGNRKDLRQAIRFPAFRTSLPGGRVSGFL